MKCPSCSSENTSDSRFCKKCATPLPAPADPLVAQTLTLSSQIQELAIGGMFAGRYQVLEELGQGGMGRVYKVLDTKVREKMALKLLDPVIAADKTMIERFKNEMKFARQISQRNVCRMYDLNETEGTPFITMEYVPGEDLKSTIRRVGPLGTGKAIFIAKQVCEGLAEAHRLGVVHRDLKPQNIMIDKDGNAHIMDFGIARTLQGKGLTGPGVMIGTPEYMSPEQVDGEDSDARADIYALGIILFEMVTGQVPFGGDSSFGIAYKQKHEAPPDPLELNPQIPEDLSRVILRCLEKNKERRYQKAEDLMAELIDIEKRYPATERLIPKKKTTISKDVTVKFRFHKIIVPAFAVAALGIVAVLAVLILSKSPPKTPPTPIYKQITFSGNASWPAISADGKFLAYAENIIPDQIKIMVQDLAGGPPIEVYRGRICLWLRWLPNGSELSFSGVDNSGKAGFFVLPRLGGTARSLENRGDLSVAWSPDGSQYAFYQGPGIRIVNKTNGEAKTISVKGAFSLLSDLNWSSAGDRILFKAATKKPDFALGTIRTDGSQQQDLVTGISMLESPRWSRKGDAIYFLQGKEQSIDLWKIAISPKTGAPLKPPSIILPGLQARMSFSITSDGKQLAYSRVFSTSHLWLADVPDPARTQAVKTVVLTTGTSTNQFPSISPDGRHVAFLQTKGKTANLYIMPLDGGSAQQITYLETINYSPAWSPDGKEIAFISLEAEKRRVWKVGSQGEQPVPFSAVEVFGYSLTWNPGSRILYQTAENRNIGMIDPNSGESSLLIKDNAGGWFFNPKYSPDGKKLAVFGNLPSSRGVWTVSLENGMRKFLFSGSHLPVGWSPDGRWIYAAGIVSTTLEIVAIHAENGNSKTVMTLPFDYDKGSPSPMFISMTPDARKFIFPVYKTMSDIWLIENFDPDIK